MFVFTRGRRAQRANAIVISSETLKMMFWRQSNAEKTEGREHGCCSDALAFCAHELRPLRAGLRFFFLRQLPRVVRGVSMQLFLEKG